MGDARKWMYERETRKEELELKYEKKIKGKAKKKLDILTSIKQNRGEIKALHNKHRYLKDEMKDLIKDIGKLKEKEVALKKNYGKYRKVKISKGLLELYEEYVAYLN